MRLYTSDSNTDVTIKTLADNQHTVGGNFSVTTTLATPGKCNTDVTLSLDEIGISRNESSRFQRVGIMENED
jgi:hypothetical protein